MNLSRVWSKVVEVLTLTAPFWLLIFGIDITEGLDVFQEVGIHLAAVVVAVKDLYQIIAGYFNANVSSLKAYVRQTYYEYESSRIR